MNAAVDSTATIQTAPGPRPLRWTREQYHRMGDLGLFEGRRVELIDGVVIEKHPAWQAHCVAIGLAQQALQMSLGSDFWVRIQLPVLAGDGCETVPDLAIVLGSPRDYPDHPATALLVVEIADTSLAFDRGHKAHLYASAGVEDYWVVNLNDNNLDIFRSPTPDPAAPFGHRYAERRTLGNADTITPLAKAEVTINVADLLP